MIASDHRSIAHSRPRTHVHEFSRQAQSKKKTPVDGAGAVGGRRRPPHSALDGRAHGRSRCEMARPPTPSTGATASPRVFIFGPEKRQRGRSARRHGPAIRNPKSKRESPPPCVLSPVAPPPSRRPAPGAVGVLLDVSQPFPPPPKFTSYATAPSSCTLH